MKYTITTKRVEPKFLFIGDVNLKRIEPIEGSYDNYFSSKFSIEIEKNDVDQFIEEKVLIDYFGSSKIYIECIEHLDMYKKYIVPIIESALNYNYGFELIDLSQHMKLEYLSEYGINEYIAISFTKEEIEEQKKYKADLKNEFNNLKGI